MQSVVTGQRSSTLCWNNSIASNERKIKVCCRQRVDWYDEQEHTLCGVCDAHEVQQGPACWAVRGPPRQYSHRCGSPTAVHTPKLTVVDKLVAGVPLILRKKTYGSRLRES